MILNAYPKNTAVVTAMTYPPEKIPPTARYLVETANRVGIQIIRFGKDEPFESLASLKVERLSRWLSMLDAKFEYVLFLDAKDVLILRSLKDICDTFNEMGSLMVMAGEPDVWPHHTDEWAKRHPQYPSGLNCLNSGTYMGHRQTIVCALTLMNDIRTRIKTRQIDYIPDCHADSDQMLWQVSYVNGMIPLKVDHEQKMFVVATNTPPDFYDFESRAAPLVMKNGSCPSIAHFPGNAWCAMPFFMRAMLK